MCEKEIINPNQLDLEEVIEELEREKPIEINEKKYASFKT